MWNKEAGRSPSNVRRNEHVIAVVFRGLEYPLHILAGIVLDDARAGGSPSCPAFAQHIVLRVDEYDCGVDFCTVMPDDRPVVAPGSGAAPAAGAHRVVAATTPAPPIRKLRRDCPF